MGEGRHVGKDVAVAAGEVETGVKTLADRRHMDPHPRRTTILDWDGTIRGVGAIHKPRSNVSTIGTYAAAADGMCHSGTLAKCAPRSATGKDTWKIATGAMRLA